MKDKFYQYSLPQPFHISVGAILFNDNYEICLHHFYKKDVPREKHFLMDDLDETYHLMRESLEGDEKLIEAVIRGLEEEFGATGKVEKYLGSKIDTVTDPTSSMEKLTIYHSVRLEKLGERTGNDTESRTGMEWVSPAKAIEIFEDQVSKTDRPELNELTIINNFIEAYSL